MASAIYCINDIKDVESDQKHPKKCKRPIASGAISKLSAIAIMILLIIMSYAILLALGDKALIIGGVGVITIYLIINIAYCFKLKQYAIIDVFIIASGFVLRVIMGGVVCNIWLSPWIVGMTFLLTLFLAFAKRRDDVIINQETGTIVRKNILRYNLDFLNQTLGLIASITIVCYIIYTVQPEVEARLRSQYVYVSSVFVLAGILRYLQVTIVDNKSGSPTDLLLRDKFIHVCILGWILTFSIIIYF